MDEKQRVYNPTPYTRAGFFSKLYLCWLSPLLSLGRKKVLEEEDLYEPTQYEKSEYLTKTLEFEWEKELLKEKPSIISAMSRMYLKRMLLFSLVPLFQESLNLIDPILISELIKYFNNQIDFKTAMIYGTLIFLKSCVDCTIMHPGFYSMQRYGMQMKIALSGIIYKKLTRIAVKNSDQAANGKIFNLLSNDLSRIEQSIFFSGYVYVGPVVAIAIIIILLVTFDYTILTGLGIFFVVLPFQTFLGRVMSHYRTKTAKITDERINIISEFLNGIKIIKMYCWEKPFTSIIHKIRRRELLSQLMIYCISGINSVIDTDLSTLITYASIAVFIHITDEPLSPSRIVFILSYYLKLCSIIGFFFIRSLTNFISARVSCLRIQEFLLQSETNTDRQNELQHKGTVLQVEQLYADWNDDDSEYFLKGISFEVKPNELLAVVGNVGSGKSSLLMALLGEMPNIHGNVNMSGSVFYVSQEPWIFSATVKQNILFGEPYDKMKFNEIVKICALKEDMKMFANGENTIIGDKGVNLSGGQRARISLARALYNDPDIYLLDDPLSAVDANVAKHLFDKCINGYLKSKIRILVTHQVHHLTSADQIIVLSSGEMTAKGTFDELNHKTELNLSNILSNLEEELDQKGKIGFEAYERQISRFSECSKGPSGSLLDLSKVETINEDYDESDYKEKHTKGAVGFNVYRQMLSHGLGIIGPIFIMIIFLMCQAFLNGADFWLSYWASKEEDARLFNESCRRQNTSNSSSFYGNVSNTWNSTHQNGTGHVDACLFSERKQYFKIYTILIGCSFGTIIIRTVSFYTFFYLTTQSLHNRLLHSIMRAKARFFDTNPLGRIMNRFSKDIGCLDDFLPLSLFDFIQCAIVIIGAVVVALYSNYWILVPLIPIIIVLVYIRLYYMRSSRELKRIEALCNSPIFTHASNTLTGLLTIRASKNEDKLTDEFLAHLNNHTQAYFALISANRWFGMRLDMIIIAYTFILVYSSIFAKDFVALSPGQVGLILIYNFRIAMLFQWVVRQSTELENMMTSVERIVEYSTLKGEDLHKSKTKPPGDWPKNGEIVFDNVSFAYDDNLPDVLKNVSLKIKSKEKIGIVGRTGAGKSTIFQTLFRMAEPSGAAYIDGVNIKEISLHDLRNKIAIIPQEPTLFIGTLRYNLDPFCVYDDKVLWDTLETVQLKETVKNMKDGLNTEIQRNGSNLSVGQKQLICLARAILTKSKILIIDEATANVDYHTDALIQKAIRECFRDCTVITIAHRLQTIMDSDKILCLSNGTLINYGHPYELLQDNKTILHDMVKQLGEQESNRLLKIARDAYNAVFEPNSNNIYTENKENHRI